MGRRTTRHESIFRLVASPAGEAAGQFIEFEATGREAVFLLTARHFANQDTEVFSDGRPLCRLLMQAEGGYWVISPPRDAAAHC